MSAGCSAIEGCQGSQQVTLWKPLQPISCAAFPGLYQQVYVEKDDQLFEFLVVFEQEEPLSGKAQRRNGALRTGSRQPSRAPGSMT